VSGLMSSGAPAASISGFVNLKFPRTHRQTTSLIFLSSLIIIDFINELPKLSEVSTPSFRWTFVNSARGSERMEGRPSSRSSDNDRGSFLPVAF